MYVLSAFINLAGWLALIMILLFVHRLAKYLMNYSYFIPQLFKADDRLITLTNIKNVSIYFFYCLLYCVAIVKFSQT